MTSSLVIESDTWKTWFAKSNVSLSFLFLITYKHIAQITPQKPSFHNCMCKNGICFDSVIEPQLQFVRFGPIFNKHIICNTILKCYNVLNDGCYTIASWSEKVDSNTINPFYSLFFTIYQWKVLDSAPQSQSVTPNILHRSLLQLQLERLIQKP